MMLSVLDLEDTKGNETCTVKAGLNGQEHVYVDKTDQRMHRIWRQQLRMHL